MVDALQQAKQDISTAKSTLLTQQRSIQQQRQQIKKGPTKTELLTQTSAQKVARATQVSQQLKQLQSAEEEIKTVRKAIVRAEVPVKKAEAIEKDFAKAQKAVDAASRGKSGAVFGLQNKRQREFFRQIQAGETASKLRIQALEEIGLASTTPELLELKISELAQERIAKAGAKEFTPASGVDLDVKLTGLVPIEKVGKVIPGKQPVGPLFGPKQLLQTLDPSLQKKSVFEKAKGLIIGKKKVTQFGQLAKTAVPSIAKDVEVSLFPATIGPTFLSSSLGSQLLSPQFTSGQITQAQKIRAEQVQDLITKTKGIGSEASQAARDLNRLIRDTDAQIKKDLVIANSAGVNLDRSVQKFDKTRQDLKDGKLTEDQAIKKQREILKELQSKGFRVTEKDNKATITHPVYDRLAGLNVSAWKRILDAAQKGTSPIKDKSLIAGLAFLDKAFQAEKVVLAFQLGGATLGKAGVAAPSIAGSAGAKSALAVAGRLSQVTLLGSFGALSGISFGKQTDSVLLGLAAGLGTVTGFLAPGAAKKFIDNVQQTVSEQGLGIKGKRAAKGKTKTKTKQVQKKKPKKKKKLIINKKQALEAFKKLPRSRQLQILEKAIKQGATPQDAAKFMQQSGLDKVQITDRFLELKRRLAIQQIRADVKSGLIDPKLAKQQIKLLRDAKQTIIKQTAAKLSQQTTTPLQSQFRQQQITLAQKKISSLKQVLKQKNLSPLQIQSIKAQIAQAQSSLSALQGKALVLSTTAPKLTSITVQAQTSQQASDVAQTLSLATLTKQQAKQTTKSKVAQVSLIAPALAIAQKVDQKSDVLSATSFAQASSSATKVSLKAPQTLSLTLPSLATQTTTTGLGLGTGLKPGGGGFVLPSLKDQEKIKKLFAGKKRREGFLTEVLDRGVWKKVAKPFDSLAKAKNFGRWGVDNTTSRRFRVTPVKAVKEFSKRTVPIVFSNKFRDFKIRKGKRISLKTERIEKTTFAIDTKGEKEGLRIAKLLKQRFGKKKTKKKFGGKVSLKAPKL